MEEEVGGDYFAVWESIDTDIYGPVHASLAELASRGRLAAVVTTNFDRLIEIALTERGVAHKVYHTATDYERVTLRTGQSPTSLPIIKLHGSIEDPSSLVDTLRQRMVGRPEALNAVLSQLLKTAPWVFIGSSGADFSYNERYLGIIDSAKDGKGIIFARRRGARLEPGVVRLVESYRAFDAKKAEVIEVDPATWLAETFGLPVWVSATFEAASTSADVEGRVKKAIRGWVDRLGPVSVVNIMCALLKSAGLEHDAWWLARKTFKSYLAPSDKAGASYHRFCYNYGVTLLELGFIRNPIQLAADKSNLLEWKDRADQDAFQFLSRAYEHGRLLAAGGSLAALLAYRGEVGRAACLAVDVWSEAYKRGSWLELCDIAIDSMVINDLVGAYDSRQLEALLEKAVALGDEPRRGMLCAHLGRLLTCTSEFSKARAMLDEAEQVARRLGLAKVRITALAARGRWLHDSGTSAEQAVGLLQRVRDELCAVDENPLVTKFDLAESGSPAAVLKGRQPFICRVLLDLTEAAFTLRAYNIVESSLDLLDELTVESFNGYVPHYYLTYAKTLLIAGADRCPDKALRLIGMARSVAASSGNPWVAQYAERLEHTVRTSI